MPPMPWPSPSAICTLREPCSGRLPGADKISPQNETAAFFVLLSPDQLAAAGAATCIIVSVVDAGAIVTYLFDWPQGDSLDEVFHHGSIRRQDALQRYSSSRRQRRRHRSGRAGLHHVGQQPAENLRPGAEAELLPGKLRRPHQAHRADRAARRWSTSRRRYADRPPSTTRKIPTCRR